MWFKLEVCDSGEYLDGDGRRVMLDWGHHVEDPQGRCNAELGYTEYASMEEAVAGFGLSPAGD